MSESALLTSVTLSSQVKNHILNLIAEQKLTPGMPVPSEVQLIQKLGVSRGIVREAYRSLAALGILETHSGKVPRIKKFDDEVLRVVFGFALATEQVTTEQILQVRRWLSWALWKLLPVMAKRKILLTYGLKWQKSANSSMMLKALSPMISASISYLPLLSKIRFL